MKWITVVLLLATTGCYRMTIRNERPAGLAPVEYDGRWHGGLVAGLAELSGPYDLSAICPRGWSEIHTETSLANGVVELFTLNIYTPQSVTIRCAAR